MKERQVITTILHYACKCMYEQAHTLSEGIILEDIYKAVRNDDELAFRVRQYDRVRIVFKDILMNDMPEFSIIIRIAPVLGINQERLCFWVNDISIPLVSASATIIVLKEVLRFVDEIALPLGAEEARAQRISAMSKAESLTQATFSNLGWEFHLTSCAPFISLRIGVDNKHRYLFRIPYDNLEYNILKIYKYIEEVRHIEEREFGYSHPIYVEDIK